MKITFKNTNEVDFCTIHRGDTFIDQEYDGGTILMCVDTCCDVILRNDEVMNNNYDGYAVDIQTGEIIGYYNDTKVIPVKAEVTVIE